MDLCSFPRPLRDNTNRDEGSTEGPVPGVLPTHRTPAPTHKHTRAEQISAATPAATPRFRLAAREGAAEQPRGGHGVWGVGRQRQCLDLSEESARWSGR